MRRSLGEWVFDKLNVLLMCLLAFITLYPFWYILVLSLNDGFDAALGGIWFWPRQFSLANYEKVLGSYLLGRSYLNTILRTVSGSMLSLVVTGFAAYALSKQRLIGRRAVIALFVVPMFIGGTIISNYVVMAKVGLLNRFLVYIVPSAFNFFLMIIMRTYFSGLPDSLEESAKIDGADYVRIFFRIVLPVSMPIVATVLLYAGVGHWLDFYTNMVYVSRRHLWVLQYVLFRVVRETETNLITDEQAAKLNILPMMKNRENYTPESIKMATLMVVTLPILFVYPFLQKYFIKGILIGSLKD